MKAFRAHILGLLAVPAAIGGAQAADLPVKAKAIEYVKICSGYGAGFFYIPGTDTCIKLGGYFRADVLFNGGAAHGQPAWNGDSGQGNRYRDYFIDRSRMVLQVDTRTGTEYGVVRTFGAAKFQFTTLGSSRNPAVLNTSILNEARVSARSPTTRSCSIHRAAAMSPSRIFSSSSPDSPSASRRPP